MSEKASARRIAFFGSEEAYLKAQLRLSESYREVQEVTEDLKDALSNLEYYVTGLLSGYDPSIVDRCLLKDGA